MLFRLPSEEELTDNKLNEFIAKHNAECAFRFKHLKDAYETDYQIFHQKPKPDYKPDNRIAVNFAKYMVDTFNGYFIGNPIRISVDNDTNDNIKKYVELLDQYNDQDDNNAELSKICCIYGKGYEMYYVDELGNIGITYLTPFDAFMIYDDSVLCRERYFVRLYMHPFYGAKGSLGTSTWFNTKFLSLKSAGQQVGRANGGLRTIILPADSTGDQEGCQNFYSYFHILFYAGLMGQTGEMCINYLTADDKLIAGVNWYKSDMSGNTGHYDLVCYNPNKKSTDQQAGRVLKTYTYMASHLRKQNPWYWNWGHCDLRKEGSKLTFFYNGSYPSFSIPEIADMKCAKIQIAIKQRGTRSGNKYLTYNGINAFYFQKLHVKKWRDVPNKFAQDCSLIANCSDGSIRMNGLPKPDLGALGNDWETFCLKPGVNQVQCLCSSWAKKPTFKMKYREVFL